MGAQHPTHQIEERADGPHAHMRPPTAKIKAENSNERSAFYNDSRSCIG